MGGAGNSSSLSQVTTYTLTGPANGTAGIASSAFTVTLGSGTLSGTVIITPGDGGEGGAFSPTSVSLTNTTRSATFSVTESGGAYTVTAANNGGLSNPTGVAYSVSASKVWQSRTTSIRAHWSSHWSTEKDNSSATLSVVTPSGTPNPPPSGPNCLKMKPATTTDSISAWWNVSTYSNITGGDSPIHRGSTPPITLAVCCRIQEQVVQQTTGFQKAGALCCPDRQGSRRRQYDARHESGNALPVVAVILFERLLRLRCAGGTNLKLAIINLASGTTQGNYLASYGAWSTIPQWFMSANDPSANSPITTAGYVGISAVPARRQPTSTISESLTPLLTSRQVCRSC